MNLFFLSHSVLTVLSGKAPPRTDTTLTICNLCNFVTSYTLLCPLSRLKLKCSRVAMHLFLLWQIIHCKDKSLEYSCLKGDIVHKYCSTFLNHDKNGINLSLFFAVAMAKKLIAVPEERGDVWKKLENYWCWDSWHFMPLVSSQSWVSLAFGFLMCQMEYFILYLTAVVK